MPEAATLPPPAFETTAAPPKEAKSAPKATAEKDSARKTEVGEKAREKQNDQDTTKLSMVRQEMQGAQEKFAREKKITDEVVDQVLLLRTLKGISRLIDESTKTDFRAGITVGGAAGAALISEIARRNGLLDADTTVLIQSAFSGLGGLVLAETFKPATNVLNKIDQWRGDRALKRALKNAADIEPQLLIPFVSEYDDLLPYKDAEDFIYDEQIDKGIPVDPRLILAKTLADARFAHLTAGRVDLSDDERSAYAVQAREYAVMKIGEGQTAAKIAKRSGKSIAKEVAARVLNLAGGSGLMAAVSMASGEATQHITGGTEGGLLGVGVGGIDDAVVLAMRKLGARRQKETIPVADAKPKNTG